jgi:2-methylcitrate dehydratase PrpD
VPGVVAVGEWAQRTGREMLTALILGYDVAVRLGAAWLARC